MSCHNAFEYVIYVSVHCERTSNCIFLQKNHLILLLLSKLCLLSLLYYNIGRLKCQYFFEFIFSCMQRVSSYYFFPIDRFFFLEHSGGLTRYTFLFSSCMTFFFYAIFLLWYKKKKSLFASPYKYNIFSLLSFLFFSCCIFSTV